MLIQNHKYKTDGEIRDIIAASESRYDAEIMRAAEAAHNHPELRFVMLSGPTCSGKTTTAGRLIESFAAFGRRVIVISIDDFYRDNGGDRTIDEDQTVDYESADAIDLEYFDECLGLDAECYSEHHECKNDVDCVHSRLVHIHLDGIKMSDNFWTHY